MKKVLIAHQSTIPHYRVPFYNALDAQRSDKWCFSVVFDFKEFESPIYFKELIHQNEIKFPLVDVKTLTGQIKNTRISYQTFFAKSSSYDLLIVENAVNNLSYPLAQLHQLYGKKFAYWGHGRDATIDSDSGLLKRQAEQIKLQLLKRANGFFAYSESVQAYLLQKGLPEEKLFVVNNTIDILEQRRFYEKYQSKREHIRNKFRVDGKKVLLFVGRFSRNKRMDFLLAAFRELVTQDSAWHLFLVGSGDFQPELAGIEENVTLFGSQTDLDILAPIYVASDLYVLTGAAGLGPLQANCYDLPAVIIDSPFHGPEVDYLNQDNGFILDMNIDPKGYADQINALFADLAAFARLRRSVWNSISHLTIENMASLFSQGIDKLLFSV